MAVRFTVVVPTLGREERLLGLLEALAAQTLPHDRWALVVAFDGSEPTPQVAERLRALGATFVSTPERRGPGAARNLGARAASGEVLAFTEDDCRPAPDWLAAAAARFDGDDTIDILEGATLLPDGAPVRRRDGENPTWLPTNLFVRRSVFAKVGGYCESFFDPLRGTYFREDSDFGFTARDAGARAVYDPAVRVAHPREHEGWLDPIAWARRYEMDPLLASRHPRAFREEIEVLRLGPFRLRRLFVRACAAYVAGLVAAAIAMLAREEGVASWFLGLAALAGLLVWSKWRFDPRKLPAALVVPPVLLAALARGRVRYLVASRTTR